jgi:hypothetical protein
MVRESRRSWLRLSSFGLSLVMNRQNPSTTEDTGITGKTCVALVLPLVWAVEAKFLGPPEEKIALDVPEVPAQVCHP